MSQNPKLRLAILQRVIPSYRTALFSSLSSDSTIEVKLFIGDDIPNSKVKSTKNLDGIQVQKLRTRFFKFGYRILPWHIGLVKELKKFNPDVILCEGESHFLGYWQAIWYRRFINPRVGLIHWCFISLPGEPLDRAGIIGKIKAHFRTYFDAFLLYSSFSKARLVKLGIPPEKAFVATNVGDVKRFLALSSTLQDSPTQARKKLSLPERFTVLYTGTLDKNKRPEVMLQLAKALSKDKFTFVILGSGEMEESLRKEAIENGLSNVIIPGRVTDNLALYYRAADVLLVPGRGGIIISEAMAFEIPVITHQADGTEYDLIRDQESGFILQNGRVEDFQEKIEFLQSHPEVRRKMGSLARQLVEREFTTANMVEQIKRAAQFADAAK